MIIVHALRGIVVKCVLIALLLAICLLCNSASAIVLHTGDTGATSHPSNNALVRWNTSSGVVISPNWVISAAHTGVPSTITIAGTPYNVAQSVLHPTADLQLVRLELSPGVPANLPDYVDLYSGSISGVTTVIGGNGYGNLGPHVAGPTNWGYDWDGVDTLRWGQNRIDGTQNAFASGGYVSDLLLNDFDPAAAGSAVAHESSLATRDSGGGWFVDVAGVWKLAGISAYTTQSGKSDFADNPGTGTVEPPDLNAAIRLSSYSSFIAQTVPEPSGIVLVLSGVMAVGALVRRRMLGSR